MRGFVRTRSESLATAVLVLLSIAVMQSSISYSTAYGALANIAPVFGHSAAPAGGLVLRSALAIGMAALWLLDRKSALFNAILLTNALLTLGLIFNLAALVLVLFRLTPMVVEILLVDVVLMAMANILIFSIWYWIIDPPGIEETRWNDATWEFLFPQRAEILPGYEAWLPRYSDYLFLAFTTSFAFSPTDTLPLSRRAKTAMLLQSTISLITITGIAASAINMLAGAS